MRQFRQIAQHRRRIGAIGILRAKLRQCARSVALHDHVEQVHDPAPIGQPQHRAHLLGSGFASAVA